MCIQLQKLFRTKNKLEKSDSEFIDDNTMLSETEYDQLRKKKQYYKSHYKNGRKSSITPKVNTISEMSDLEEDAELCDYEPDQGASSLDSNQRKRLSVQLGKARKQSLAGGGGGQDFLQQRQSLMQQRQSMTGGLRNDRHSLADIGNISDSGSEDRYNNNYKDRRQSNMLRRRSTITKVNRDSISAEYQTTKSQNAVGGTLLKFLDDTGEINQKSDFDTGMSEMEKQKLSMWKRKDGDKHRKSVISIDACHF